MIEEIPTDEQDSVTDLTSPESEMLAEQPEDPTENPQVFAVTREANKMKFTRREFLELAAAGTVAITALSCKVELKMTNPPPTATVKSPEAVQPPAVPPTEIPSDTPVPPSDTPVPPTDTPEPTPTDTSTPEPTYTKTPTATATKVFMGKINQGNVNLRKGPGTYYDKVGAGKQGEAVTLISRTGDSTWLRLKNSTGLDAWISATFVTIDFPIEDIPIEQDIPPAPTGVPGGLKPGQTGINYSLNGRTYNLPCGAPLPAGAVCICNCVTVPTPCSCDGACSCDRQTNHYWYPN